MRKESSEYPASLDRMVSFIKTMDQKIEVWVCHLINQIENENCDPLSRDE
ncbi:MAG: hypothetical protein JJU37_11285 [Balneolaceae bacterium]|nr:hypothetical protein [Balneolaceae bacterium]